MNKFITVSCKVTIIKSRNIFGTPTKVEEISRNFAFNVNKILTIKEFQDNGKNVSIIVLTDGSLFKTEEDFHSLISRLNDLQK